MDASARGPGEVTEVVKERNGIDVVNLLNLQGATAKVSLHGGQVLSWKNTRGEELLFTSGKAIFRPPEAVRGGIPIWFPQFGKHGPLELSGFACRKTWIIDSNPPPLPPSDSDGKSYVDLLLKSSDSDRRVWPHSFEFRLRVSLDEDGHLILISRIKNIDSKRFNFCIAFHTYFSVSDISEVRIEGLDTLHYLDNLRKRERFTEQGSTLIFESEVDRVYVHCLEEVLVFDHEKRQTFSIKRQGLPDVVVWNPWDKTAKALKDFGNKEYKQMLCVGGAAIENPIILKPGEEWTGRVDISWTPST